MIPIPPIIIQDPGFVQLIYEIYERNDDYYGRNIVITPYFGMYDSIPGMVITVEGSPPKATIFYSMTARKFITDSNPVQVIDRGTNYYKLMDFLNLHGVIEKLQGQS